MKKLFQKLHNRVLPFLMAVLMLASTLPLNVLSTGRGVATEGTANGTPSPDGYIYDYDTLKITKDGKETYAMDLLSYEKITISAYGVEEKATYQWQIMHNEKENVWIDIYDATEKDLPVTLALLGNLLRDDNTAKLRCRAYTEDYAYLTSPITVTVKEPAETKITIPTQNVENPSFNAEGDEPEHPEFVTVTIEYMLVRYIKEDGAYTEAPEVEAFSPYIATLAYNSSLSTTVDNPNIVGFTPYFNGTKCEEVTIELTGIKEDVTYKVLYKPSEDVPYRVQYLFQNVYDDLYSEDKTVTGTDTNGDPITGAPYVGKGTTGLPPKQGVDGIEFEGFTALYYQPDTIAADGSTAFEVYYERNYYLMEFDCNGGYGVNTVYVRYGTYVSIPTPVRHGYVFATDADGNGWDLVRTEQTDFDGDLADGVPDELPSEMPPYNTAYKALWKTVLTTYTVVYWRENADDDGFSYWGSEQKEAMSASKVSGSDSVPLTISQSTIDGDKVNEKPFFTYNDSLTDKDVLVEGDGSSIVNVYYNRNVYTLRFPLGSHDFTAPVTHTHANGVCYGVLDCDKAHKHDGTCKKELNCSIPEHTAHTGACLTCTKTEHEHTEGCVTSNCEFYTHTHTTDCCILEEHTHNITCYGASSGYVLENNQSDFDPSDVTSPQAGYVYRYQAGSGNSNRHNYFYDGTNWYYLGTANQYRGLINSVPNPSANGRYTSAPATKAISCGITAHNHTSGCVYCTKEAGHTPDEDCCTLIAHTHTTECYVLSSGTLSSTPVTSNSTLNSINNSSDKYPNGIVRVSSYYSSNYYYKIGDSWYQISGFSSSTAAQNATISISCGLTEHTHGTGCQYCCINNHQHTAACYKDEAHKHGESCYKDALHTHEESCYIYHCGKDEHVHNDDCYTVCNKPESYITQSGGVKYYVITAKYDQTIGDQWPTAADFKNSNYYGWDFDVGSTLVSKRVTMSEDLCTNQNGRVNTGEMITRTGTIKTYLNYMFESYDSSSGENSYYRKQYNGVFYDRDELYSQVVYRQDGNFGLKQITGMSPQVSNAISQTIGGEQHLFLYYKRNRWKLSFHNVNETVPSATKTDIMYGYPIKELTLDGKSISEFIPPYPSTYEPGAYEFKGWYTTPGCYKGTEVDWDKITLPNNDLTLYAKWVPIQRNVYFFEDLNDLQAFEDDGNKSHCWQPSTPISYPIVVDHGTLLGSTYSYIPTRTGVENPSAYYFVGWFYFDENGKKKFAPDSMEVDRDLYLFAEWKTSLPTTYHIEFEAWKDSGGTKTKIETIANALDDYSTAGKTVTFDAAGGTRLYDLSGTGGTNYRERWFPETASHSLLMDADSENNTYTFRYFNKEYINYKVIYKDRVSGKILGESEVKQTHKAIVTEKYKPFENYYPEQYYIERPIAYDPTDYTIPGNEKHVLEENIIYFYYVPDTEHAPYHVKHFKENVAGDGYDLAKSYQGIADLNKTITEPVSEYTGFVFDHAKVFHYSKNSSGDWIRDADPQVITNVAAVSGTVTLGGLDIEIYYKRIEVGYTVRYMLYGTTTVLETVKAPPVDKATFGSDISHTAPAELQIGEIKYTYYLDNSTELDRTQSMTIRENAEDNVLTFYYKEKTILVNYHVVCTVPSLVPNNAVSLANERAATPNGLAGSTAMPGTGFTFKGWFMDAACTTPVPTEWLVTDKHLKPLVLADIDKDEEEHFYALFEPIYGALRIEKKIDGTGATGATFLFRVKGNDHNNKHIDIIVSIQENTTSPETVLLNNVPIGEYTVTELTDWSWEFTANTKERTVTVLEGTTAEVSFTNKSNPSNWLSGETVNENQFKVTPTP